MMIQNKDIKIQFGDGNQFKTEQCDDGNKEKMVVQANVRLQFGITQYWLFNHQIFFNLFKSNI
ncbi:unnamed protein product [Paramecium primaurelia]|uniref:Uncharacterized protein n=1 Tax=Paramecium primaurelia TaxID=5886 RepID=A0A8S1NIV0_PARPR|nr:unnamed protein product [Paramecium primaurelia]CAD8101550.1 unnamed protein product [Paramecium primaurelia]